MSGLRRVFAGRKLYAASLAALCLALFATGVEAKPKKLETGFLEVLYGSGSPSVRDQWFDRTVDARAGVVRLHVFWRSVAPTEPAQPQNPADPAYDWGTLDGSITDAADRGLRVLLTITAAPDWAEGGNRPGNVNAGSWKPSPPAYGQFAHAVAERYSGDFSGLPRVRHFQAWNEQNLEGHLSPQYEDGKQFSVDHYRRMLNAFYRRDQGGGCGQSSGNRRHRALRGSPRGRQDAAAVFLRKLMCLTGRKELNDSRLPHEASIRHPGAPPDQHLGRPAPERAASRRCFHARFRQGREDRAKGRAGGECARRFPSGVGDRAVVGK